MFFASGWAIAALIAATAVPAHGSADNVVRASGVINSSASEAANIVTSGHQHGGVDRREGARGAGAEVERAHHPHFLGDVLGLSARRDQGARPSRGKARRPAAKGGGGRTITRRTIIAAAALFALLTAAYTIVGIPAGIREGDEVRLFIRKGSSFREAMCLRARS